MLLYKIYSQHLFRGVPARISMSICWVFEYLDELMEAGKRHTCRAQPDPNTTVLA
jgi:hypothetical protein